MRTLGMTMDSHLAGLTSRLPEDAVVTARDVDCNADIYASQVFLSYRSPLDAEHPARPYMHIVGECRAIRGQVPCGVREVRFDEGEGIPVDILYEFGNEELSDMVMKGLYDSGFKCPSIITDNVLEMPVFCNFKVVEPQVDGDAPIVFADIADRRCIVVDEDSCGYRFGDYFEEAVREQTAAYDEFEDYDVYEHEELFGDDYEHEDEVEAEAPHELTPREQAIEEHYENIRTRVVRDHILHKGGLAAEDKKRVPHKELKAREVQKEPALEDTRDEVEMLVDDAAAAAVAKAAGHVEEPFMMDDIPLDYEDEDFYDSVLVDEDDVYLIEDDDFVSEEEMLAEKAEDDVEDEHDRQVAVDDNIDANDDEAEAPFTDGPDEDEAFVYYVHDVPEHVKSVVDGYFDDTEDDSQYI